MGKRDVTYWGDGADGNSLLPESCDYVITAKKKMLSVNAKLTNLNVNNSPQAQKPVSD